MRSRVLNTWLIVALCAWSMAAGAEPATVIFVDAVATGANDGSSWVDAHGSLQDALAAAALAEKPVEVRVAQGVYKPDQGAGITPGDRAATFQLLNGVTLSGGYAGTTGPDPDARDVGLYETILSGDLAGDGDPNYWAFRENSNHVVTASGTDAIAVIDGFTITGGSSVRDPRIEPLPTLPGGEAILMEAASPVIRNCSFSGNYDTISMGAVLATSNSTPVVTNCVFLDQGAGGMSCWDNSNAALTGCRFEHSEWGVGLVISSSSPTLTDCTFVANRWRGMIDAHDCNSVLTNCVFTASGIETPGQGIQSSLGHLTLTGCTFTGLRHGAIDAWGDLTLVHCAFSNNGSFGGAPVRCVGGLVTALECTFTGNRGSLAGAISGTDMQLHDCEFTGNSGIIAGAVSGWGDILTVTGCVFSGNAAPSVRAIDGSAQITRVSNCTFVGNRGRDGSLELRRGLALPPKVTQCIIWDGTNAFSERVPTQYPIEVTYCDVQGGHLGRGNIDVDPCFVDPGCWDPNGTPDDANDDFWVAGDYHLKSQGGHWDRATETWIRDDVTSACIDAGDPNNPLGVEPFPNGGFINMGAYGGTAEASKSYFGEPVCETQLPGDINGDCKVNQTDMDILMAHWLMEISGLVNTPPTVTLLSPQDGAEITYPAPILFQCAASDPDGIMIRVKYTLERRVGNGRTTMSITITDPANDWDQEFNWSNIHEDGTYTAWAEVMDDEGARTASPKITVTLHPAK